MKRLEVFKGVGAVFFDLNDLLYKSGFFDADKLKLGKDYLLQVYTAVMGMDGFSARAYVDILCKMHKYPMMALYDLAQKFPDDQELKILIKSHYMPYWQAIENVDYTQLKKNYGIKDLLLKLNAMGIQVHIVTNSYKEEAKQIIKSLGLQKLFHHVIFGEKLAPHGKYNQEGFQIILDMVDPKRKIEKSVFFDDAPEKLELVKDVFGDSAVTVCVKNTTYPAHVGRYARSREDIEVIQKFNDGNNAHPNFYTHNLEYVLTQIIRLNG